MLLKSMGNAKIVSDNLMITLLISLEPIKDSLIS
jgi:hypothetical protein